MDLVYRNVRSAHSLISETLVTQLSASAMPFLANTKLNSHLRFYCHCSSSISISCRSTRYCPVAQQHPQQQQQQQQQQRQQVVTLQKGLRQQPGTTGIAAVPATQRSTAICSTDPLAASIVIAAEQDSAVEYSTPFGKQQLLDVAATFVKLWFAGIAKGPQAVEQELATILSPDVLIKADRVKHFQDIHGLHEVLGELERAHLEYHRSEHRPMLYAASPEVQRAYALVEGTYQDVGAMPGHPATFRISKVHHILSMEVQGGRIAVLWLYRQLTEEDKDELLHEPLACYPAPFPRDSLVLVDAAKHAAEASRMVDTVQAWWHAWAEGPKPTTSGSSTDPTATPSFASSSRGRSRTASAAVGQLLAPDFRMWDAYGLWPAMRAQGRRYLNKDAALRYMHGLSYAYNAELTMLEVAVAEGSLACFSHWQARLVPKWPVHAETSSLSLQSADVGEGHNHNAGLPSSADHSSSSSTPPAPSSSHAGNKTANPEPGQASRLLQQQLAGNGQPVQDSAIIVDGMAVDLFNAEMQLKVMWVFRGPFNEQERQLFLEYDKQQAAAEAAQAASNQAAVRAARRAQRDQQLSELLAWMNNYQQQWSSYVTHVQKQIARQQRLAKQQLIRQLQESQSLEASVEEEELELEQQQQLGEQLQQQLMQAQQQLINLQEQAQQQLRNLQPGLPDRDRKP